MFTCGNGSIDTAINHIREGFSCLMQMVQISLIKETRLFICGCWFFTINTVSTTSWDIIFDHGVLVQLCSKVIVCKNDQKTKNKDLHHKISRYSRSLYLYKCYF